MSRALGIYIHVPFCKQKCVYCDFYSLPRREEDMDAYVSALRAQLAETDFSGYEADTVYFGGGTPSYLGPRRLAALLEAVSAACPIAPGAEITSPPSGGRGSTGFPWGCSPPTAGSSGPSAGSTPQPRSAPPRRPPGRRALITCP